MMYLPMLLSKIHRATVTDAQLHYEGSLTIDAHLLGLTQIQEYQQIQVYNVNTGARFETYAIVGEPHSGIIQVNGAAAHLAKTGDIIIIAAYGLLDAAERQGHHPKCVYVNAQNQPVRTSFEPDTSALCFSSPG